MSVNKVIIIGRLGADPELKTMPSGQNMCRISLATSENWTDKDGNKQERTEWHRIIIWGRQADSCSKYLSKGSQAYVEGRIQTRSWEDQDGQKKYTTEIIANNVTFLDSRSSQGSQQNPTEDFGPEPAFDSNSNEEIPF